MGDRMRAIFIYALLFLGVAGAAVSVSAYTEKGGGDLPNSLNFCYSYTGRGERSCPEQRHICDGMLKDLEQFVASSECMLRCEENLKKFMQVDVLSCSSVVWAAYSECRDFCRSLE